MVASAVAHRQPVLPDARQADRLLSILLSKQLEEV